MLRLRSNRLLGLARLARGGQNSSAAAEAQPVVAQAACKSSCLCTTNWQTVTWTAGNRPFHHLHQQQQQQQNDHHHQQQQQQSQGFLTARHWWQQSHSSHSCRYFCSDAPSSSNDGSNSSSSPPEGTNTSSRPRDMAIVFTCAKCDTRSVKAFTRQAYEAGLVLLTCPGCKAMHLIADHLGWFGDTGFKIDEYLAAQGQQVKRVSLDPVSQAPTQHGEAPAADQLTAEDVAGWTKVQQLLSNVAAAASGSSEASEQGGCCGAGGQHGHSHSSGSSSSGSSSGSSSSSGSEAAAQSDRDGHSTAAAAATAAAAGASTPEDGVMQVTPADAEAWARVQLQVQPQK